MIGKEEDQDTLERGITETKGIDAVVVSHSYFVVNDCNI